MASRYVDTAREGRLVDAAQKMGLDLNTPEGLLAADAYEATMEWASTGTLAGVEKGRGPDAQVVAEAHALHELANPGTFEASRNPVNTGAIQDLYDVRTEALQAHQAGRLAPSPDGWSKGWVETFPELTDTEKKLGQLPGFTPAQIARFQEGYTPAELGFPNHTGGTAPVIENEPLVTLPPENVGTDVVTMAQTDGDFQTPNGRTLRNHGIRGTGEEYMLGNGHTGELIDDILDDPAFTYQAARGDTATAGSDSATVVVGKTGDWVVVNDRTGDIIQINDRFNPRQELPK